MKRFKSAASAWVIIALFALLVIIAMSQEAKASEYRNAEYIENYDADSITLKVWLWPGTSKKTGLYATENMRLYGVDTPEKGWRAKCEKEKTLSNAAENYVRDMLTGQNNLLIKVQPVRGGRGRPLISVWIDIEGGMENLSDMLIINGYARPYFGGIRQGWCN